jgi:hypothetical protein
MECGHCRSVHHLDCWNDNAGCAVMACAGGPSKKTVAERSSMTAAAAPTVSRSPTTQAAAFHPQPSPAPAAPRGGGRGLIAALVVLAVAIAGVGAAVLLTHKTPPVAAAAVPQPQPSSSSSTTTSSSQTTSATVTNTVTVTGTASATDPQGVRTRTVARAPSATAAAANSEGSSENSDSGAGKAAAAVLDQYWNDINSGDYPGAYDLESASEQHKQSVSDMAANQSKVNILWTTRGVPDEAGEASRISFDTVASDGVCRHFSIDSQMVQEGSDWVYDGPIPGAALVDQNIDGNRNCPS